MLILSTQSARWKKSNNSVIRCGLGKVSACVAGRPAGPGCVWSAGDPLPRAGRETMQSASQRTALRQRHSARITKSEFKVRVWNKWHIYSRSCVTALDYEPRQYRLFSSNHLLDSKLDKAWLHQTLLDCYYSCVVLFLAYFVLQVIYARRKYKVSPPKTTGHPEFERIFRAQ